MGKHLEPIPLEHQGRVLQMERWPVRTRKVPYGTVPHGYKVNEHNRFELLPDPEQIFFIEQAFDYVAAGNSLREVTEWLISRTGRHMVHQTLNNLYNRHRKPFLNSKTLKRKSRNPNVSKETRERIAAQNKARAALKRLEKLKEQERITKKYGKKLDPSEIPSKTQDSSVPTPSVQVSETRPQVKLFEPTPAQNLFLQATEREVLYGGAAGGEDKVFLPPPFAVMRQNKSRELLECPT